MCVCLRRMTNCQTRTPAKSTWMACAISTKSPVGDIDAFAPFCRSHSHIIKIKLSTPHRKHSTSMHFPCHYRFTVGEFFFLIFYFYISTQKKKKKKWFKLVDICLSIRIQNGWRLWMSSLSIGCMWNSFSLWFILYGRRFVIDCLGSDFSFDRYKELSSNFFTIWCVLVFFARVGTKILFIQENSNMKTKPFANNFKHI
jgi:hypothetical protein